ncbi:MAG: winged helix-turn-helix domain-containing protein [Methanotrichaceae archaeon]|nr:winged helix-turn-helix domain-containing protein [Methanotrichaceae archaeon]
MIETTIEEIFGVKAGMVWEALNHKGPSTVAELTKATSLSREEVFGALDWLGREDKISVEMRGRARVFLLPASPLIWPRNA